MNRRQPMPEDLKELRQLVRDGKLFAVQKWIADGNRVVEVDSSMNRTASWSLVNHTSWRRQCAA